MYRLASFLLPSIISAMLDRLTDQSIGMISTRLSVPVMVKGKVDAWKDRILPLRLQRQRLITFNTFVVL